LRREWIDDIRASIGGTHKDEMDAKEAKKKNEEVLQAKNEVTGKVAPPTLTQVGKKPKKDDDDDDDEAPERPKKTKSKKPRPSNPPYVVVLSLSLCPVAMA